MRPGDTDKSYKWIALSNTTIGMLVATINSSIVLISLPAIFNGIKLDPLQPANAGYLLWMLMGYMIVTAVLVVSLGRVGDMYGRVRMYNLGFAVFTLASIGLSLVFNTGPIAAMELIALRIVQGVGGAMLMANAVAILTDAFPENERGLALGVNGIAALAGSFVGLILGGLLSAVNWHLIFLVSVPFGLFGTVWAYLKLKEGAKTRKARLDWLGNITFAAGLIAPLAGITGAIQPGGKSAMTWDSPQTLAELIGGLALLALFVFVESRVQDPMFHLDLFRDRGFTAGNVANFLAAVGRGGLMFILIIWLQGIWLPLHGYSYESTPLWAGIYMLPQTFGFLVAGPISGYLSDRYGARPFATAGMIGAAVSFILLLLLPANFSYVWFALMLLLNGISMGMFSSPNTAAIMNSVPAEQRGAASGMRSALMNTGMTLSVGLFFSLIIVGLSRTLPNALYSGLTSHGVASNAARHVAGLPPVSSMFAAFLGYNPVRTMLTGVHLNSAQQTYLFGRQFFPSLIAAPFMDGMHLAFYFSTAMMIVAAIASYLRGSTRTQGRTAAAPVITISATLGSGGTRAAQIVAERLQLPLLDRAIPLDVAERLRVPVEAALSREESERETLQRVLSELAGSAPMYGGSVPVDARADVFKDRTEEAIRERATRGGGVIVGRGAALVLRGWKRCLHVRIYAPKGRMTRADALAALYVRHFYDADINDKHVYDLVLDGSTASPEELAERIVRAATPILSTTSIKGETTWKASPSATD